MVVATESLKDMKKLKEPLPEGWEIIIQSPRCKQGVRDWGIYLQAPPEHGIFVYFVAGMLVDPTSFTAYASACGLAQAALGRERF